MAYRAPRRPTDGVDFLIGLVGGVGVLMLVVTVYCELTGQPALIWALALLVLVVATGLLIRHRGRVLRRHDEDEQGGEPLEG
jgi:nitrate/nitrite transporter NarK